MHAEPPENAPFSAALPRAAVPPPTAGVGQIVNIGSVAGLKGVADEGSYSATKWAMRGWSTACYEVGLAVAACPVGGGESVPAAEPRRLQSCTGMPAC